MKLLFSYFVILSSWSIINGLNNGLALTPPMGWMHWQRFRCVTDCDAYPDDCVSENLFRTMADLLVKDGYLAAGYEYIIIDDCWASKQRDPNTNRLVPCPYRFPNGIKALADYIHSKGLKFGIYGDYGTKTCAGYPGSLYHLELDANTFAEWGVDYLKLDGCHVDIENIDKGYAKMGKFLNNTGRPIVYSCSWPAYEEPIGIKSNYTALVETCNLWRNWDDIDDTWSNVTSILKWFSSNQERISSFSGPGHWNDPDMLIIGNFGLSYEQSKAQMAIWAVMAAPLIMSVDLRTIEPKFRDILLNKDIIKINQDPLGIAGRLTLTKSNIDIWTKKISPVGEENTYAYAIGMLSQRVDGYPYRLNFTLSELELPSTHDYLLKDIYNTANEPRIVKPDEIIFVRIKPSGGELFVVTPNEKILEVKLIDL